MATPWLSPLMEQIEKVEMQIDTVEKQLDGVGRDITLCVSGK